VPLTTQIPYKLMRGGRGYSNFLGGEGRVRNTEEYRLSKTIGRVNGNGKPVGGGWGCEREFTSQEGEKYEKKFNERAEVLIGAKGCWDKSSDGTNSGRGGMRVGPGIEKGGGGGGG